MMPWYAVSTVTKVGKGYSHLCLLSSFYNSILTLDAVERAYTACIMASWTGYEPVNIYYSCYQQLLCHSVKLKIKFSADSNAYHGIHNVCRKWYPHYQHPHSHNNQNHQNHSLQYLSDHYKYHLLQGDYKCLLLIQLPDGICIRNSDLCLHIALHSSHLYQSHNANCCFRRHSNHLPLVF